MHPSQENLHSSDVQFLIMYNRAYFALCEKFVELNAHQFSLS